MRALLPNFRLPGAAWLALALLAGPARAEVRTGIDELIAEMDKAFAVPALKMKPPLLIFPTLGGDEKAASDGVGLSHLAKFDAVYTDRKHIAICAPLAQDVLREAGCL